MCPEPQGVCPHFYVFCKKPPDKSTDGVSVGGTMNTIQTCFIKTGGGALQGKHAI